MHKKHVWLLMVLGLSSCGMLQTPTKPTPSTETTPNTNFDAQGTPTVCTNQSAGGSSPYSVYGPLWRQQFFLNDNGTPLNYSTFSTDLPSASNISMNPYVYNSTGGTYTPVPWMYQYIFAPNVTLSGTQSTGAAANNVVVTASGSYGLLYNNGLNQFDLPVISSSNKFKLYDAAGNLQTTEYGGSQTYYPTINNNRVRIPIGQKVTLEFYLDPNVQYRKEMIWATFKDASGVSKTDWVTVNMPYQEGVLKVNAATYTVQEATGIKTYQSAVNPLPKFKFVMRGYNNLVSSDRQFMNRQGIYYTWPSSVPSGDWAAWNQFMDERKDYVLNWNLYDQRVGSASVDSSGEPVLNAATVSTAAQWNLGTPGYANDKNCISKTVAIESGITQWLSVIQTKAVLLSSNNLGKFMWAAVSLTGDGTAAKRQDAYDSNGKFLGYYYVSQGDVIVYGTKNTSYYVGPVAGIGNPNLSTNPYKCTTGISMENVFYIDSAKSVIQNCLDGFTYSSLNKTIPILDNYIKNNKLTIGLGDMYEIVGLSVDRHPTYKNIGIFGILIAIK